MQQTSLNDHGDIRQTHLTLLNEDIVLVSEADSDEERGVAASLQENVN